MPEAACNIVDEGTLSYESAVQSMQSLINQAVVAGSNCVILVEGLPLLVRNTVC